MKHNRLYGLREIDYQIAFAVHSSRYLLEYRLDTRKSGVRVDVYDSKAKVLIELKNATRWYSGIGQLLYYHKLKPETSMCLATVDEMLTFDKIELLSELDISYIHLPNVKTLAKYAKVARINSCSSIQATITAVKTVVKPKKLR